jgi:ligand-binding sensor domain-containing protein
MKHLLYIFSAILVIVWAVGLFIFNAGILIHVFLIISVISVIRININRRKPVWKKNKYKAQYINHNLQFVDHYSQFMEYNSHYINHNLQLTNLK